MIVRRTPPEVRFARHVRKTETCWLWTAQLNPSGYGAFNLAAGRKVQAHRYSYELHVGPIPEGLVIDHLCRTPACVRPDHLEPVTYRENARRSPLILKSACPAGHPYVEGSYYLDRGNRSCKECKRESVRRYAERWGQVPCDLCGETIWHARRAQHLKAKHPEHHKPKPPAEGFTPERKARALALQRERRRKARENGSV